MMEATASPAGVTEQELKTGLSLMGEGSRRGKINAMMLGFGCMMDDSGQMVVTRVLQESPAAYSGQVGIGDVIDAIDGRMVTSLQLLTDMADGPEDTLVSLELRRKGDVHSESLHLMRQMPHDASDSGSNDGERAGLGARVVHDVRGMKVCDLYEGSSSYWSALKIDDIVCSVDGQDIRHGPPSLVLQLTNGSIGTSMCLQVIRKESPDDEIVGALSARGLGGRDSSHVNWKDAKEPVLMNGEKLIKVHVVRSRPLADSSLARALGYRARVVDLLQKRIERALLEGSGLADESEEHSKEGESGDDYKANVFRNYGREPGDITQLSSLAPGSPISNRLADTGHSDSRKHADDYNGIEPLILTQGQFSASFAAPSAASPMEELKSSPFKAASPLKTPRTTKLEAQLTSLQEKHEHEMRKLQDQIAGLASVISARRSGVLHDNGESEQAHAREVEKGLLECVEKMRIQQQEEKTNTIALFQRHCQMTMASQERLAEELHREIQELRKKEGETLEFKQSLSALAEKVDQLNLNNVLLGNIPGQFNTSKGPTASSGNHHAASRNPVPQLPLKKSRGAPEPALAISKMQHKKPALKYSNSADQPVGVSITIGADFDRVQKHEKRFSDDLTSACAWCLQASQDRFVYCHIERGSVIAKLNIVADLTGNDPRSCRRLAEELAAQVAHPHSPVRKAPVTKPATKVVIHQPLTPGRFLATPTLQPLSEVAVSNAFESPREDFSELGMDSPQREAGPEDETWTEAKKQEHLAAMKRRLEEMDAVVSNLAASVPLESNDMEADTSDPECPEMNEHDNLDRTSDAWPPTMHPFTDSPRKAITILPLKSVADLSLEQPPAKAARGDKISTKQHKSRTHSSGHYRALPPTSSAFELESVLSRLEHNSTPVAPHASKRRSDLEQSKANRDFSLDDSQNSKAYLPVGNEFTSSLQIAMLPHSTNQWAVNQYAHEKGTLTPGSEASMNMSRRSASPTESKKWRVLPQWSQNDFDVNGKATPRSQVVIGTPRSQVVSARGGKEPQTLSARPSGTGKASLVKLPIHSNIAVATIAAGSQRGNSPNRRRRQYARSDSSSDDDAGPQALRATARSTPLSSARSNHNQGDNAPDLNAKKKNNAKAILDSDSDEEVRVRTSDLPVRRTVNQRFSK